MGGISYNSCIDVSCSLVPLFFILFLAEPSNMDMLLSKEGPDTGKQKHRNGKGGTLSFF